MRKPHPVDAHVGKKLRMARLSLGKSQSELAKEAGVSFQQVQKYEKGTNRISASRLFEFSKLLGVDVAYFFYGASENGINSDDQAHDVDTIDMEIARNISAISNIKMKRAVADFIGSLSEAEI